MIWTSKASPWHTGNSGKLILDAILAGKNFMWKNPLPFSETEERKLIELVGHLLWIIP